MPLIPLHLLRELLAVPLIPLHCIDNLGQTYWSSLCGSGSASLHPVEDLRDSEVGFLHALLSLVRFMRFHQDLG